MERYGIIVTEKVAREDGPVHWLLRGTIVKILEDKKVECVAPCYGNAFSDFAKRKHVQNVGPEDVIEIEPEQMKALSAYVSLHPRKLAIALRAAWPITDNAEDQIKTLQTIALEAYSQCIAMKLLESDPSELMMRLTMRLPETGLTIAHQRKAAY